MSWIESGGRGGQSLPREWVCFCSKHNTILMIPQKQITMKIIMIETEMLTKTDRDGEDVCKHKVSSETPHCKGEGGGVEGHSSLRVIIMVIGMNVIMIVDDNNKYDDFDDG